MMGIYIRKMEMPLNCTRCACSDDGSRYCRAANEYIPMLGKPKFCPLVEIKEPHGRLIDADALAKDVAENALHDPNNFDWIEISSVIALIVMNAVIERSEDDER